MKKTLLLGTALVVGVAGFAQSTAKKAVNPKHLQKSSVVAKNKILAEPMPTKGTKANAKNGHQSTSSACSSAKMLTTSWNCFGVGGGSTTSSQNCLSYNQDLNTLTWTQRGSAAWPLNTTSGYIQGTLINATTLATDSVMLYHDATTHHGRYPGGVLLNPSSNTNNTLSKAFYVASGQVTDGSNWTGAAYTAKPLWSASAVNHTASGNDSLYAASPAGIFGACAAANLTGAPAADMQYLYDGKTVVSLGTVDDATITATDNVAGQGAIFAKGVLNANGTQVDWSYSTILPPVHKGALGYNLSEGRMAFG